MSGILVQDALTPVLTAAADTLTVGASPVTGAAVEVLAPRKVRIVLKTPTVASTGNTATASVEIQASDTTNFAVFESMGRFALLTGTDAAQSSLTRYLEAFTQRRYMRAVWTITGTASVYTGATVKVQEDDYFRRTTFDAATLGQTA